ncbi:MAG: VOC family protein [Planctomycetota bacterium]|nr:VOC family protein [Planctomycetota bacterium]
MAVQHIHHEINYIEFSVTDLEKAKQFYGAAFGWKFTDYGPEYVGIPKHDGEGEIAGMCKVDFVTSGGPLVVLYSKDLDASLTSVKEAGAELTVDITAFPGGRRFQFHDPFGNELAVWSDDQVN